MSGITLGGGQAVLNIETDVDSILDKLSGATGLATFPAAAVAANGVSLAESLRYVQEVATPQIATRATAALPATTAEAIFTTAGGNVEILGIIGEVTTVIETQACNAKLTYNPTGTGTSSDICAVLDITAAAVGTIFTITGTFANAMAKGAQNFISKTAAGGQMANSITIGPGTIDLDCSAANTGSVQWTIWYRKWEAASTVVAS